MPQVKKKTTRSVRVGDLYFDEEGWYIVCELCDADRSMDMPEHVKVIGTYSDEPGLHIDTVNDSLLIGHQLISRGT